MNEFNSIKLNGESYEALGHFTVFYPAIVIECSELVQLFKLMKDRDEVVKEVVFHNCNDMVSSFHEKIYVVDVIKNNEVQLYPIKNQPLILDR